MLTKEEIEFRRTKIGASDAASILGISPWKTANQLWKEKVQGLETKTNSSMQRGNDMEAHAREEFEKLTGLSVMPIMKINPKIEWQIANFDGMTFGEDVFVEIKCPNKKVHEMALNGQLPDYYMSQLQHQLCVAGLDMGFYFSFDGQKGALVEVKKDQDYIDDLLEKESKFWECMLKKSEPSLTEKDFIERTDDRWIVLTKELIEICALEERKAKIREELIELSEGMNCKGGGIRLMKKSRSGLVDYKAIPQLKGIDLESFRKCATEYFEISEV